MVMIATFTLTVKKFTHKGERSMNKDILQFSIDVIDSNADERTIKKALESAGIKVVGISMTERWTQDTYGYSIDVDR